VSNDFCLTHGYEHMKTQFGNPIPYCKACDDERALISDAEKQAVACHCGKDGHALGSINCPVHGRPQAAIDSLTNHQVQCDEDGVMIQVSRQALHEVLAYLAASHWRS
jgi:hypothetical protein